MKVEKLRDGLAVALPDDIVEALGLKLGDEIDFGVTDLGTWKSVEVRRIQTPEERKAWLDEIRSMQRPLPPGYKFNRAEANGFEEE